MELGKIRKEMLSGKTIEEALEGFDWREFEDTVAEIFEANNFRVKRNFRFKTKKRHEIDIIATKENIAFCVDCKEWGRGRYKKTGLRCAIRDQKKRVKELMRFSKKNPAAKELLKIDIYP
ncbi:MAG: restriction endonuclease, partial [Candidatus Aenigmarchaeota archaeon]|nr:restriction endonuclease [Candidatus Aenigmarchaeota archaeon]